MSQNIGVERNKRYPDSAVSRQEQGAVKVFFSLDRQGSLIESRVQSSSGVTALEAPLRGHRLEAAGLALCFRPLGSNLRTRPRRLCGVKLKRTGQEALMSLTMRPTRVQSPVDKNRQDFTIFSGKSEMGRIYEDRSGPVNLRWFWSLHGIVGKPLAMRTDGRAPTLDEAKAQFEAAWRQWLAWADLREM